MDGRNFFGKPIRNDLKSYDNIREIAIGNGDDNDDYDQVMNKQLDV